MFWDGPATKRRGGDTHYLAFVLGDERYALGGPLCRTSPPGPAACWGWAQLCAARREPTPARRWPPPPCLTCCAPPTPCAPLWHAPDRVLLWTGGSEAGKDSDHVLARLDNMWEDCCGAMWVEVTWFYFPEELHCGRLAAHEEREVFESHTSDETELAAIVRKVKVLSKDEFDALPAAERKHPDTYFCRYHYDPNRRKFMPIIQSLKKASLGGLETFKAQGIVPALLAPKRHTAPLVFI